MDCCTGDNDTCPYGDECMFCGQNANEISDSNPFGSGGGDFFNDEGTPVDPMLVHTPELCLSCLNYLLDEPEENPLCTITRMDIMDGEEFSCFIYRKSNQQHS